MLLNLKHKQGFFYELCYFNFVMNFVFTWELQSSGEFRSHSEFFRSYEQLILLTSWIILQNIQTLNLKTITFFSIIFMSFDFFPLFLIENKVKMNICRRRRYENKLKT